ncbi:MAG: 50S ribosomal protein L21 [Candidatus Omnitrophica bacterium]|nr:50S ribosomal protein L21 [Candidatus Omnitrophota bacterium]MDD5027643.1 50S ribosomal protein L21 [Candidatus Omnitrophota bacterium]MDD5662060.1 50S ribosomal protein L21 [Candidatus Omnitrophota bacterium]
MYAIIEVGAKQYQVTKDDVLEVDKQLAKAGKDIVLDKVLLVSKDKKVEIGQPYLKNTKVTAEVLGQVSAKKTTAFKYRRRKNSHWEKGHRAKLTRLKIKSIEIGG